jgi:hypothetical protein
VSLILKLNWMTEIYLTVLKSFVKIKLWLPFFLYAVMQFLLLAVCVSYVNPILHSILVPLVSLLGEGKNDFFSHYPGLYLMLPTVFQWGKLILGVIFEGLAAGATAVLFMRLYRPEDGKERIALRTAFSKWPQLLITWTIITAVLIVINLLLPKIFSGLLLGSPRRINMFDIFMRIFTIFIYAIFVYAVPAIIVGSKSIWGAFKLSFSFFGRFPIFSFFLIFIPYLLIWPISYLSANADSIVSKFSPELVFYILLAGIVVDMIVNFVVTGAIVKILIDEKS